MGRNRDGRGTGPGNGAGERGSGPGVLFWVAMVGVAVVVASAAADGDLLRIGAYLSLGLFLALQQTALPRRSVAWRWGHNALAVVFFLLAVLLILGD